MACEVNRTDQTLQKGVRQVKVNIIFHSVCGNTYLMARQFMEAITATGSECQTYRVEDSDLEELADLFPPAKEYSEEIRAIPTAGPEALLECDMVILGCPTYFGNVSAEMKTYLDSAAIYWQNASLFGKKILVFTSVGDFTGGGDMCLKALINFAQHMGMIHIPVPSNLECELSVPAYGFIHVSGETGDNRPDENLSRSISAYIRKILAPETIYC